MSGLREQKRERTRARIQQQALRLIAQQGYGATRCEEIAAAAEVSPATLFRYFPTKEDIVLSDVYDPMIAAAVLARPAGEQPLEAVRRALTDVFARVGPDELEVARQRTALVLSVPALRARTHEQAQSLAGHLAAALAERGHHEAASLGVQVAAATATAALTVAVRRWAEGGGHLPDHVDAALGALADVASLAGRVQA